MKVYNVNLGIGFASSGVEYAQAYRYQLLKELGIEQKYIFLDMVASSSIYSLANNIGIDQKDVLWFYDIITGNYMRDSMVSLRWLKNNFKGYQIDDTDKSKVYLTLNEGTYIVAYEDKLNPSFYNRLEYVVDYCLVKKEYYAGFKVHSVEYYTPVNGKAYVYKRDFFLKNGIVALTEFVNTLDDSSFFYQEKHYSSKEALFGVLLGKLGIKKNDWVLLDRSTGTAKAVFTRKQSVGFKLGVVVHAEHYVSEGITDNGILFNNYYEYQFKNRNLVDAFICSTQKQADLLSQQLDGFSKVFVAPAGYLEELRGGGMEDVRPKGKFVTVSRLSDEKNLDILIKAFAVANQGKFLFDGSELTLDIYGEGVERSSLEKLIKDYDAESFITLKGHHKMDDLYKDYSTYVSASFAEGFGLSLMEAVGSGLFIVGYNVDYGNTNFVVKGRTGILCPVDVDDSESDKNISALVEGIRKSVNELDNNEFVYDIAKQYLKPQVAKAWKELLI
jgi:accessory Sec system glycosylation protein GtfA